MRSSGFWKFGSMHLPGRRSVRPPPIAAIGANNGHWSLPSGQSTDRPGEQHERPRPQDAEHHPERIAGMAGHPIVGLFLRSSEPGADPHLHRRRTGPETGAERRHPGPLVVERQVHRRRTAASDHPPGLRGVGQPHRPQAIRAPRAGDAVPANTRNSVPPSAPAADTKSAEAASRCAASWQSLQ
jgi:hypothetical protein